MWRFGWTEDGFTFQVSCPVEHFDRWANSAGEIIPLPKTKQEFDSAIHYLLESSKDLT